VNSPDSSKYHKKIKRSNDIAKIIITVGGYGVIASIVLILMFLLYESLPLIISPSVDEKDLGIADSKANDIIATGLDRYTEVGYFLKAKGQIVFFYLADNSTAYKDSISLEESESIISFEKGTLGKDIFAVGTNKGRIITAEAKMSPEYHRNSRTIKCSFKTNEIYTVENLEENTGEEISSLDFTENEDGFNYWGWVNQKGELKLRIYDSDEEEYYSHNITSMLGDVNISSIKFSSSGELLMVGTDKGDMFWFDLSDPEDVLLKDNWRFSNSKITKLEFLIGDNSLLIGQQDGSLTHWFPVRKKDGDFKFTRINDFEKQNSKITSIQASPRNRSFFTINEDGEIYLGYSTTKSIQLKLDHTENKIISATYSPKADGLIVIDTRSEMIYYSIDNDHPETNLNTLFGKVWYEGYENPAFVWQTTGGSDEFESKFSLIPLIFGTLKGTFYAMIFSIPLALLTAIYVSQFAPKKWARIIKPTIEIMAALPSVVIGFLAGLYFSPLFEKHLITAFALLILIPIVFLMSIYVWKLIPENRRLRFPQGAHLVFIIPFLAASFITAISFAPYFEDLLFNGNLNQWLYNTLAINYDQRNSFVVGFALGFAVIPIIFTISEDALSNVPKSLTSASLALGASQWQAVMKIVLPAAAGGIFAAIMLGLGRAIGETMIVLMATGNTPIMDLSPFNGFRAMSAAIAVEIPEAPVDGTLYRVLFLTALMLFIFTFVINSFAAWIGDKLRKKYARF